MTSTQQKISQLLKKGISRKELEIILRQIYTDRVFYGQRKPAKNNGSNNKAIAALNLIYYNQWVLGPYLRELRRNKLPWYKRLFGGKANGIQSRRKTESTKTDKGIGGRGRKTTPRKTNSEETG